jgi:hypothetical protein
MAQQASLLLRKVMHCNFSDEEMQQPMRFNLYFPLNQHKSCQKDLIKRAN